MVDYSAQDTAVLCRTNFLASQFREFLRGRGVPVAERKRARLPADWKTAKLVLTVLASPHSDFAQYQLLTALRGKPEADRCKREAAKALKPLNEFGLQVYSFNGETAQEVMCKAGVSLESRELVAAAAEALRERGGDWTAADLLLEASAAEQDDGQAEGAGVTVSTVHGVKGREFAVVFVCGMEEGCFPSNMSKKDGEKGVEEERRLCFVAVTRAKDRCYLTRCEERPESRGPNVPPGPPTKREPSRFLKEMNL